MKREIIVLSLVVLFLGCSSHNNIKDALVDNSITKLFTQIYQVPTSKLEGTIKDLKTGLPLQDKMVFVSGTTHCSVTDSSGKFSLHNVARGKQEVLVFTGNSKPFKKNIEIKKNSETINLNINCLNLAENYSSLTPDKKIEYLENELENTKTRYEIEIQTLLENQRVTLTSPEFHLFNRFILGKPDECKLLNPVDLRIEKSSRKNENWTKFSSVRPLIIQNYFTGYKMRVMLKRATLSELQGWYRINIEATICYEDLILDPKYKMESVKWISNRMEAFKGSKTHFLISYLGGTLGTEGFSVFIPAKFSGGSTRVGIPGSSSASSSTDIIVYDPYQYLGKTISDHIYKLRVSDVFGINYAFGYPDNSKQKIRGVEKSKTSYLFSPSNNIVFTSEGMIVNNKEIRETGYWAAKQFYEFLPENFIPEITKLLQPDDLILLD